jgi:hypothetical protein
MELFYAATTILIGDGGIAKFWHTPWLEGRKPKDIAPSIFAISKRKNFTVNKGMQQKIWIFKIKTNEGITLQHLTEFVDLWVRFSEVHLVEGTADDITWKLSNSGSYTAVSAYKAQFEEMTNSYLMDAVWMNWASPKFKLFAWQILQNREWTADRLQKRGWTNCDVCQLCRREPKTTGHTFFSSDVSP